MTKKMGLMALGLSMVLLSGCSDTIDDLKDKYEDYKDGEEEYNDAVDNALNTPAVAERNIVGTWNEECTVVPTGAGSYKNSFVFNEDNTGGYNGSSYSSSNCSGDSENWEGTFTYSLGEATFGDGNEDAVELDMVLMQDGNTMYWDTMVHFISVDALIIARSHDTETRSDIFEGIGKMVRQ